ncbi:MAG: protein of unknown function transrane [Frankiales bacterium]|nr:protein of unknown function transrane [Frankiales bacterium]
MTYLLALTASALWGTGDFLGGRLSRRHSPIWVVAASQSFSLLLFTVVAGVALLVGYRPNGSSCFGWGVAGGLAVTLALATFYKALAVGAMGVVAPIASLGVAVPVVVGLVGGERPAFAQAVGIAMAITGVVLASRAGGDGPRAGGGKAVGLALVASAGFGAAMVCLDHGAGSSVPLTLVTMRTVIVMVLGFAAWRARPANVDRPTKRTLVVLGLCDGSSNAAFALASVSGALALVAVLASLYPVVTALLARRLLHERLSTPQWAGVAATLAGTVLIVV